MQRDGNWFSLIFICARLRCRNAADPAPHEEDLPAGPRGRHRQTILRIRLGGRDGQLLVSALRSIRSFTIRWVFSILTAPEPDVPRISSPPLRTAIPCPGGVSQGVCPDKMNCIAETQCADEAYLQFLREQQAKNGSGKPVLQAKPGPAPAIAAPTPPAATTNASDGNDARCTSDGDCQAGRFCHQPDPSAAGHCGACVPSSGAGCSTEQVCRTPGCHGGLTEPGVTKCFERWDPWELNKDCEMRLNDADAKCDVDTMLCSSGQSQQQNDAGSGSDAGVGASMYENEEGNSFFCGETYADITGNCLLSKVRKGAQFTLG